jgi:hypothetical protein
MERDEQGKAEAEHGDWHPELDVCDNGFQGAACGWRCAQTFLAAIKGYAIVTLGCGESDVKCGREKGKE